MREYVSRDLTELASQGALPTFCGRDDVLRQIEAVLSQEHKNSLILTGGPGVGKTAVVEGFAQRIASGTVRETLKGKHILELDTNSMVADTMYRGEFESRAANVLAELSHRDDVIAFVDEIHSIIGVGGISERPQGLETLLKPYLARGEISMIGATTDREFEAFARRDPAFARRFTRIRVPEPSRDEAVLIVRRVGEDLASKNGLVLDSGVAEAAVDLSVRFVQDRCLPDKAVDLIVASMSEKTSEAHPGDGQQGKCLAGLLRVLDEELAAIDLSDWPAVAASIDEWFELKDGRSTRLVLSVEDVARTASTRYRVQIPEAGDDGATAHILSLEETLKQRIFGQDRAIVGVCGSLKRMIAGLRRPAGPIASFMFLGPTGVGKTELARSVADTLWGEGHLVRFDMSEYMERQEASKLIGAPPGYTGYEEGGRLVRAIATQPSCVVLFDEIEKAHADVHNLLLQILEDGRLTDSTGVTASFNQTLVMLTSNFASEWIDSIPIERFGTDYDVVLQEAVSRLKRAFRPEIINRIDEIVLFAPLGSDSMTQILELEVNRINRELEETRSLRIELTDAARDVVLRRGFDRSMGARPLRRALQTLVLNPVSSAILEGKTHKDSVLVVDAAVDESIVIQVDEGSRK